jgi:hypothetical protein
MQSGKWPGHSSSRQRADWVLTLFLEARWYFPQGEETLVNTPPASYMKGESGIIT